MGKQQDESADLQDAAAAQVVEGLATARGRKSVPAAPDLSAGSMVSGGGHDAVPVNASPSSTTRSLRSAASPTSTDGCFPAATTSTDGRFAFGPTSASSSYMTSTTMGPQFPWKHPPTADPVNWYYVCL